MDRINALQAIGGYFRSNNLWRNFQIYQLNAWYLLEFDENPTREYHLDYLEEQFLDFMGMKNEKK